MNDYIDFFKDNGYVIIENVLSPEEIMDIREQFHNELLLELNIDHYGILEGRSEINQGPRLKSGIADIFYSKWKLLDVQLNNKVYQYVKNIVVDTYGKKESELFSHPYSKFDDVIPFIDRVCWRLPDHIRAEGGLGLHIDRNYSDPYLEANGGLKKWRPVQSFIALTDHFGSESGGIKLVKDFHKEFDDYFKGDFVKEKGEFYRMSGKAHEKIKKRCQVLNYVPKGSLVIWDNRLPHATCDKLISHDTREVIYLGYIPNISLNKKYQKDQWGAIKERKQPPAYDNGKKIRRDWEVSDLTPDQLYLLSGF